MSFTPKLVLASGNPGKLAEFTALLAPLRVELVAQSDLAIPECAEPAPTFIENALLKARHASHHSGRPALADDSGLCVAALAGAPGVRSARYALGDGGRTLGRAEQDAENNALLLRNLDGQAHRRAHFVCVLAAVRRADDPEPLLAHGWLHGSIVGEPAGDGGFGYDPLFQLSDGRTLAQLDPAQKNALSHRARACEQMMQLLQAFWGLQPAQG